MNNNKSTQPTAFELGVQYAQTFVNIDVLDTEASDPRVSQWEIREYFAGIFAGLNQRMGRLQYALDLDLENGNDDHAVAVEQELEQTYALVKDFAKRYMF